MNLPDRIRLFQLRILTEFLRHYGTDVESRAVDIDFLLNDLLDGTDAMKSIRGLRYFNTESYIIRNIGDYPPVVKQAIADGLNEVCTVFKFMKTGRRDPLPTMVDCDYIEVTIPTKDLIGLHEAKKMRDLLRSMAPITNAD